MIADSEKLLRESLSESGDIKCFSTPCIQSGVQIAADGAAGATKEQLLQFVSMDENYNITTKTCVSSKAIYLNSLKAPKIHPEFSKKHDCKVIEFSPAGADVINQFISTNTHGKIKKAVDDLNEDHIAMLLTIVAFKGEWMKEFDPRVTRRYTFHGLNGDTVVPMMSGEVDFGVCEKNKDLFVKLKFKDGMRCIIAIPKEYSTFVKEFNTKDLKKMQWRRKCRTSISIPKFVCDTTMDVGKFMKAKGIHLPFEPSADFSRMVTDRNTFISSAMHRACFEIDEKGVTAVGTTEIYFAECLSHDIFIDRPFVMWVTTDDYIPVFTTLVPNIV